MEGSMNIISFDDHGPQSKRRKALKACDRCRNTKKGCIPLGSSCTRCDRDSTLCSFANGLLSPISGPTDTIYPRPDTHRTVNAVLDSFLSDGETSIAENNVPRDPVDYGIVQGTPSSLDDHSINQSDNHPSRKNEARYSTMLDLINGRSAASEPPGPLAAIKLIGDTNPLSALLRKDLKHKIVTSLCAFRSPEPVLEPHMVPAARSSGRRGWDWQQAYAKSGVDPIKMRYLIELECFNLPGPEVCGGLLETFFTRVHPLLPVIDRQDFLARYYGTRRPPPLILLLAILLSASRYSDVIELGVGGRGVVRDQCDKLHAKFRALIEVNVVHDRLAIVQASLLASLHWEGREGINSALDSLSLAIRLAQELGLHRRTEHIYSMAEAKNTKLQKRIWWCAYALDRLNAAQEGTTLMINEGDCDVEELTEEDFDQEDELTCCTTLLHTALSLIVEKSIRALYSLQSRKLGIDFQLQLDCRDRLTNSLDKLSESITSHLQGPMSTDTGGVEEDIRLLWASLLQTYVDAVKILIHRPFLVYFEVSAGSLGAYRSREISRACAKNITYRLKELQNHGLLRYSWPFTIYGVVSAMLIFWYDLSSPSGVSEGDRTSAKSNFVSIVRILEVMGETWWAAAAKHKLGEALLRLAGGIEVHQRAAPNIIQTPETQQSAWSLAETSSTSFIQASNYANPTPESFILDGTGYFPSYEENLDFWTSIGLDFENDVAAGVYGIM